MTAPVYDNFNYEVVVVQRDVERDGTSYCPVYEVRNKHTKVAEYCTPALPEAIHVAAAADVSMQSEPWQWHYKKMEAQDDSIPMEEDIGGYIQ